MPVALQPAAIVDALRELPGWSFDPARPAICRTFQFSDFSEAWGFMSRCALEAERMQHHPEWHNVWATVAVTLTTHDCAGVSTLDLQMAATMNRLAGR